MREEKKEEKVPHKAESYHIAHNTKIQLWVDASSVAT
jgi:hypothetical protein